MWVQETEGTKYWPRILSELQQRGVSDMLILCADGLKGMSEAVEAVFPKTVFQTCIVHVVRSSTRFVSYSERRAVCKDLRAIYSAVNEDTAKEELAAFDSKWADKYPMIGKLWRQRWPELSPFLSFPKEIRRAIYTTNAIESLNSRIRKILKTRGHMPSE